MNHSGSAHPQIKSVSRPLFYFVSSVPEKQTQNNENVLSDCTMHYLLLLYWILLHYKRHFPLMYAATSAPPPPPPFPPHSHSAVLRSAAKPSGKFPPCFSLGATAWCRNRSKSYFSWGNCKWSARLKKRFHLSPNEAFTDPVSKLRCNKLLPANINEICSLIAKTSRPQHDCFSRSGARRTLVSIFFFMQQEQIGTAGSIGDGSFEIKTWDFSQKMERQVGSLDCSAVWFLRPRRLPSLVFSRTRHLFITFRPSIIPSREKRDRRE